MSWLEIASLAGLFTVLALAFIYGNSVPCAVCSGAMFRMANGKLHCLDCGSESNG